MVREFPIEWTARLPERVLGEGWRDRRDPDFWFGVVLVVGLLLRGLVLTLPLDRLLAIVVADDYFYYLSTAWNIAAGHGSSVDYGVTVHNGYHPLFMVSLWVAAAAGLGKIALMYWGFMILTAATLTAMLLAYRVGAQLGDRRLALCTPIAIALSSFYLRISFWGFETALVLALTLATILSCLRSRSAWEIGLWLGLTTLARIDAGILAIPVALFLAQRGRMRAVPVAAAVSLVLVLPWIVWSWSNFGSPVPLTAGIKSGGFDLMLIGPGAVNFARHLLLQTFGLSTPFSWLVSFVLGLVMLVPVARKARGVGWLIGFVVLAIILYSAFSTPHLVKQNQRYLTSAIVVTMILFFVRGFRASAFVPLGLAVILIGAEAGTYHKMLNNSLEPNFIALGRSRVPAVLDRIAGEDDLVGCFDSGSIGYFAERPVVNLDGLVNAEVVAMLAAEGAGSPQERYARYLRDKGITILVGGSFYWPNYFPDLDTWETLSDAIPYRNPDGSVVFLRVPSDATAAGDP